MKLRAHIGLLFIGILLLVYTDFSACAGSRTGSTRTGGSRTSGTSTGTSSSRRIGTGTSGTRTGGSRSTGSRRIGTGTSGTGTGGSTSTRSRRIGTGTGGTRRISDSGTGSITRRTSTRRIPSWRTYGTWQTAGAAGYLYGYNRYRTRRRYRDYPNQEPTICTNNYAYTMTNGSNYNFFICPLGDEDDSYTYCCGPDDREHCCGVYEFNSQVANSWGSSTMLPVRTVPPKSWSAWSSSSWATWSEPSWATWSQPSWATWSQPSWASWAQTNSWSSWTSYKPKSSSGGIGGGAIAGIAIGLILLTLLVLGILLAVRYQRNRQLAQGSSGGGTNGPVVSGSGFGGTAVNGQTTVPSAPYTNDHQQMQPLTDPTYPPGPTQPYPPPNQPYPPDSAPPAYPGVYPPPSAASPYQPGFSQQYDPPPADVGKDGPPPPYPAGAGYPPATIVSQGSGPFVYQKNESAA